MQSLFRECFKEPCRTSVAADGREIIQRAFIAASAPACPWLCSKADTDLGDYCTDGDLQTNEIVSGAASLAFAGERLRCSTGRWLLSPALTSARACGSHPTSPGVSPSWTVPPSAPGMEPLHSFPPNTPTCKNPRAAALVSVLAGAIKPLAFEGEQGQHITRTTSHPSSSSQPTQPLRHRGHQPWDPCSHRGTAGCGDTPSSTATLAPAPVSPSEHDAERPGEGF